MIPGIVGNFSSTAGITSPSYIGNSGKNASTGGQTVSYPSGITANDYLILIVHTDDVDSIGTISGWNKFINQVGSDGTNRIHIYGRFKGSSTSVYVPDPGDHQCASVLAFSNVNLTNPLHKYTSGNFPSTGSFSLTGVTTTNDKCYIIYGVAHDQNNANPCISNLTGGNLTSAANLIDISTTFGWDGGFACRGGKKEVAGATGTVTGTADDGQSANTRFCIALNGGP